MLRIAIREAGKKKGTTALRDVADRLVKEAADGNIQAIKELADRLDGKPVQQHQALDEEGRRTRFVVAMPLASDDPDEWQRQHSPTIQ